MKIKSVKNNIYQIVLTKEEEEARSGMEGVEIEELEEMMESVNTYIKYMVDYTNGNMLCQAPDSNPRDHIVAITTIIKSLYETLKKDPAMEKTAEWFRYVLKKTINDGRFWDSDNKRVYKK